MTQFHTLISRLFLILPFVVSGGSDLNLEPEHSVQKVSFINNTKPSGLGPTLPIRTNERETFSSVLNSLLERLRELGLESSIDRGYFEGLIRQATEKELELMINCKHRIFASDFKMLANIAYRGKGTDGEIARAKRHSGQTHGFVYEDPTGFVFLGVISGSSKWLPDTDHSSKLAHILKDKSREIFLTHHSRRLSPERYLEKAWKSIETGSFIGGVTALYVTINPDKVIEIANIGKAWAGLYREGTLVSWTTELVHEDGSVYHLCKIQGLFKPVHYKDKAKNSLQFKWQAEEGDVFIVVSQSVREVLSPEEIYESSTIFQNFSLGSDPFAGASGGIIQRARYVSPDTQNTEKIAIAVKLL